MKIISTILFVIITLYVLVYITNKGIATQAVPSLQDYMKTTFDKNVDEAATTTDFIAEAISDQQSIQVASTTTTSIEPYVASNQSEVFIILRTPTTQFRVTTAKTPKTREKGLSGRDSLDPDEGLLFIFPTKVKPNFWMKDMNFPIDIIWIDAAKKVVGIENSVSPDSFPTTFSPPTDIQFVLEVNAGIAQKAGIKAGDYITF